MKNPWIEFKENPKQEYLVLDADRLIIDKFNETANENHRIHTNIMPAPFMGNVLEAPVILLLLNPGYDEKEEQLDYYNHYRPYWENEIQHQESVPGLPLFCLDEEYCNYSNYWQNKLKYLIKATSKNKVAHNVALVQFFPYHSKKFKNIPKKISSEPLESQVYSFHLVKKAMDRNAIIILMRSRKEWYSRIPSLEGYKNLYITKNPRNPILTENNLDAFSKVLDAVNK